jgi:hypothetical protein
MEWLIGAAAVMASLHIIIAIYRKTRIIPSAA